MYLYIHNYIYLKDYKYNNSHGSIVCNIYYLIRHLISIICIILDYVLEL